jgi:hypothetical protein
VSEAKRRLVATAVTKAIEPRDDVETLAFVLTSLSTAINQDELQIVNLRDQN